MLKLVGLFFGKAAKAVFSPTGLRVLMVIVVVGGLFFLGKLGLKAYNEYTDNKVTVEVLGRENARVRQTQELQAQQYKEDLKTQQIVFQKVVQDQTRQIGTLASRVNRVQKLDRDFAVAQKEIASARPEDDADAAPVLDDAADFLQSYFEARPAPTGTGDADGNAAGGKDVRQ